MATKHQLSRNCLACGRILCVQEDVGICVFCGAEPGDLQMKSPPEAVLLPTNLRRNRILEERRRQQIKEMSPEARNELLQKAMAHKNRLVQYDKTAARRTKIIDDHTDYFEHETNIWLDEEERDKLLEKHLANEARQTQKKEFRVTFDLAGREVRVAAEEDGVPPDAESTAPDSCVAGPASLFGSRSLASVSSMGACASRLGLEPAAGPSTSAGTFLNPTLSEAQRPTYIPVEAVAAMAASRETHPRQQKTQPGRIQHDNDFLAVEKDIDAEQGGAVAVVFDEADLEDTGACLSMHQPWASLLVMGIKKVEGRTWKHSHRGRLWIHAASKPADLQTITAVERQYMDQWERASEGTELRFPTSYPTSVLLGRVDVVDQCTNTEYRTKTPLLQQEETESPFLMICENPIVLRSPIPVSGEHKIWNLPLEVLLEAQDQCNATATEEGGDTLD
eukprot:Rmarinus@m.22428